MSDNELVDILMSTLQGLYFEKMIGKYSIKFADIVTIGEHIENKVKLGKIAGIVAQAVPNKKLHEDFTNKKEGETSAVTTRFLWLPCHIILICMLPPLNINNLLFNINLKMAINNHHWFSLLRLNNMLVTIEVKARTTRTTMESVLTFTRSLYHILNWYHILFTWGLSYQKNFLKLCLPIISKYNPNASCSFH